MKQGILRLLLVLGLTIPVLFSTAIAQPTSGNIKGQIVDRDGGPLPGASVTIKGTTRTVASDLQGNYEIFDVKEGTYTLQVNYMGYKPEDAQVVVRAGQTGLKGFTLQTGLPR